MTENLLVVSKHVRFLQCKFVWSLVDDSVHVNKTTRMLAAGCFTEPDNPVRCEAHSNHHYETPLSSKNSNIIRLVTRVFI